MVNISSSSILLWAQIGEKIYQIGQTSIERLRAARAAGIELDDSKLAELDKAYSDRIAAREEGR